MILLIGHAIHDDLGKADTGRPSTHQAKQSLGALAQSQAPRSGMRRYPPNPTASAGNSPAREREPVPVATNASGRGAPPGVGLDRTASWLAGQRLVGQPAQNGADGLEWHVTAADCAPFTDLDDGPTALLRQGFKLAIGVDDPRISNDLQHGQV